MEEHRILDPGNNMHIIISALRYIYVPRINNALQVFKDGWNSHGVRTEQGQSPEQIFVAGLLRPRESRITALDFFDNISSDQYGVEEEGLVGNSITENNVIIPENPFGLTNQQIHQLEEEINPLEASQNHGIELYEATVEFIYNLYNSQ